MANNCSNKNSSTPFSQTQVIQDQIIFQESGRWKTTDNYKQMSAAWQTVWSNLQDTTYFRNQKESYLPSEPLETAAAYNVRLNRSFYNPLFKDGTRCLVSKPFSRAIVVEDEEIDERLQRIQDNADLMGSTTSEFFKDVMLVGLRYGHCHVLVDFQQQLTEQSRAEERSIGARPNFKLVNPYDLIWYDTDNNADGTVKIVEAHIKEIHNIEGKQTLFIRIYKEDTFELWQDSTDDGWILVDSGNHTFGGVPLLTYYTNKTGFLLSEPPLFSAAEENIELWQSSSDHKNILKHVSVALLYFKGAGPEDIDFSVSVNNIITGPATSDLKYVEHSGKGLEAGRQDIERIVFNIKSTLGAPLVERTGDVTATESIITESKASCDLLAWVEALNEFILKCYMAAAQWVNVELPDEFKVAVFKDWINRGRAEDLPALQKLVDLNLLSKRSLLEQYKRRGILGSDFDIDLELERIETEDQDRDIEDIEDIEEDI